MDVWGHSMRRVRRRGRNYASSIGLLARFGDSRWVEVLATLSGPQEGRENRAVTGGKFLHSPRRSAHALDFTKSGQEPGLICKAAPLAQTERHAREHSH